MKHSLWAAVSAGALLLAGCGSKTQDPAATDAPVADPTAADVMATDGVDANASDGQNFANTAASSDAFEIATSKLAADKAKSSKVKAFAQQMIKAHSDSTAKLKKAAAAASPAITSSPDMTAMQQQTLDQLGGVSGADFDTAYAKAQVEAHQMTLDKLKAYSASGSVPTLKSFAKEITPVVTKHLEMAKGL
jgi:putative membrane protein